MTTKPKKYTGKYVLQEVQELWNTLQKEGNENIMFLQELIRTKPYGRQRWSEWKAEFCDIEQISDTIKKIEDELSFRIQKNGLNNKANVAMAIFLLKNNYGMSDKVNVETQLSPIILDFTPNTFENDKPLNSNASNY